jgi:2-keto-3-deoxy-L-rhamnonate aldolase RhmA
VPAKLTAAQAQQVLAALLQQIGTTTDPAVLRVLAAASKAVAAKLTDVQAQQVLAPLLQQPAKALAVRRGRELG